MSTFIRAFRYIPNNNVNILSRSIMYAARGKVSKIVYTDKKRRVLQKIMDKHEQKYGNGPFLSPRTSSDRGSKGYKEPKIENNNNKDERAKALSKYYMENISDLISSGSVGQETQLLGFNITKVVMHPSGQFLYVAWVPSTIEDNVDTIQEHLNIQAPKIRYELINQKNIGSAPVIRFGQDKSLGELIELERALAKADFGTDYQSTVQSSVLSQQVVLPTLENPPKKSTELLGPAEMTQDIMNLDYNHLMTLVRIQPFKKIAKVKGPYGEYDLETEKDFYLFLRKRKFERLYVERNIAKQNIQHTYMYADPEETVSDAYIMEDGMEIADEEQETDDVLH